MNFEDTNTNVKESIEEKKIRVGNSIQLNLMSSMCNPDDGQKGIDEWLDNHLQNFKILVDEALENDPKYLDKWDEDLNGERERSLDFFINELRKLYNSR